MRHKVKESDPASDRITRLAVELAQAVAERSHWNKELVIALANAAAANEKAQRRFRSTVLIRLSRIETIATREQPA